MRFRLDRRRCLLFGLAARDRLLALALFGVLLRLLEAVTLGTLLIVVRLESHYRLVMRTAVTSNRGCPVWLPAGSLARRVHGHPRRASRDTADPWSRSAAGAGSCICRAEHLRRLGQAG